MHSSIDNFKLVPSAWYKKPPLANRAIVFGLGAVVGGHELTVQLPCAIYEALLHILGYGRGAELDGPIDVRGQGVRDRLPVLHQELPPYLLEALSLSHPGFSPGLTVSSGLLPEGISQLLCRGNPRSEECGFHVAAPPIPEVAREHVPYPLALAWQWFRALHQLLVLRQNLLLCGSLALPRFRFGGLLSWPCAQWHIGSGSSVCSSLALHTRDGAAGGSALQKCIACGRSKACIRRCAGKHHRGCPLEGLRLCGGLRKDRWCNNKCRLQLAATKH
mmetsp:Transcript_88277/g.222802  ORF Transcript_88277/g.222802 Transcript_88277/m.222802 type:complete len:275 (+) Transcript_88277:762-1586(+)